MTESRIFQSRLVVSLEQWPQPSDVLLAPRGAEAQPPLQLGVGESVRNDEDNRAVRRNALECNTYAEIIDC